MNTDKTSTSTANRKPMSQRLAFWLSVVIVVLSGASAVSTGAELANIMGQSIFYKIMAYVTAGAFAFGFSVFLIYHTYYLPRTHQNSSRGWAFTILTSMYVLYLMGSTVFSVIFLAGKDAVQIDESSVVEQISLEENHYIQLGYEEDNLILPLQASASVFDQLAVAESKGQLSGLTGSGLVVAKINLCAQSLRADATQLIEAQKIRAKAIKEVDDRMEEARTEISAQVTMERNTPELLQSQVTFQTAIAKINNGMTRLHTTSQAANVNASLENLNDLSTIITKGQESQNEAIAALQQPVDATKKTLQPLFEKLKKSDGNTAAPQYGTLSPERAVFKHAASVPYAWGLGLLQDGLPFLILLSVLVYSRTHKEIVAEEKAEAAEAEEHAAATAARERVASASTSVAPAASPSAWQ